MYRKLRRNIIAGKTEKKGPNMIDENILNIQPFVFKVLLIDETEVYVMIYIPKILWIFSFAESKSHYQDSIPC